ncbi:MAG: GDSL-type esterase/lipase family protein [Flaviramulus sp.]|nr:GDSL-type esterase/lipase family protein [Flaviramulus sp.]
MKYFFKKAIVIVLLFSLSACGQTLTTIENDHAGILLDDIYPDSTLVIATHTEYTRAHYLERIKEFKENPLSTNDIVFVGNSLTELGGDWGKRMNNPKIKNRGIGGDTTEGVLARLGELIYFKPRQIFILIGINDLFRDDMTSEKVFNNILKIVNQIHDGSPKTKIYVQTILPTTTVKLKEKIQLTNTLLINSESTESYKLIPLHEHFATENDLMDMNFSADGVHLNENGYSIWVNKIISLIQL